MKVGYNLMSCAVFVQIEKEDIERINGGCNTFYIDDLKTGLWNAMQNRNKELLEENKKLKKLLKDVRENELEELRYGITEDTRYILDKMERCDDYSKLNRVLVNLEKITAEI